MKKTLLASLIAVFSLSQMQAITMPEWVQSSKDYVNKNWQCLRYGTGPDCTKEKRAQLTKLQKGLITLGVIGGTTITGRVLYQKMRRLTDEEAKQALDKIFGKKASYGPVETIMGTTIQVNTQNAISEDDLKKLNKIIRRLPLKTRYEITGSNGKFHFSEAKGQITFSTENKTIEESLGKKGLTLYKSGFN